MTGAPALSRAAALLLLLMAVAMLGTIARKSITNDETTHIPAGYYDLVAGAFHLNNEHPPLSCRRAALTVRVAQAAPTGHPTWRTRWN